MVRTGRAAWWPLLGLVLALAAGCASSTSDGADDEAAPADEMPSLQPGRGEVAPSVRYAPTAEGNYLEGEKAFEDEQYLAAQRYFGYIRSKFPYSRYAVLAELRIADCQYERKRYLEAIDSYQNFLRLHPTHPKAAYARFRVGKSYFEQIPSNFFLLPPAHEKDQSAVMDAEKALRAYVEAHPDGENVKEASEILAEVRKRLMAHERYVADFYKNLDRDRAYVGRLEVIRKEFSDVGLTDELLLEITEAWAALGEASKARSAYEQLEKTFPESDALEDAKEAIAGLPAPAKPEDELKGAPEAPEAGDGEDVKEDKSP